MATERARSTTHNAGLSYRVCSAIGGKKTTPVIPKATLCRRVDKGVESADMSEFWEDAFVSKQLMWGLGPTRSALL
ncbi:MAG TPA: hypothetical protein VMF89_33845, partial [Polyangiales bacterium]|nr:hypothetical protein [Polyangiales bacterium]